MSRSERRDEREIERGAHAGPRRGRTKRRGAERRGAERGARWLTVAKKGKERREKVEVCCAAVGTDCRASELSSLSHPTAAACRLSLYRSGRAAPVASPSVVFARRAASRSIESASRVGTEDLSSSLAGKRIGLGTAFPFPRPIVFIVLWISPPPPSASGASRWSSVIAATGAHAYTYRIRAEAHCSRRKPRLFSNAWPRFLADFIPIPRNKLADDHGGICLLGDLSSPFFSFAPDLFLLPQGCSFSLAFVKYTSRASKLRDASLPREKKAV